MDHPLLKACAEDRDRDAIAGCLLTTEADGFGGSRFERAQPRTASLAGPQVIAKGFVKRG
jgi:hypothetical protein